MGLRPGPGRAQLRDKIVLAKVASWFQRFCHTGHKAKTQHRLCQGVVRLISVFTLQPCSVFFVIHPGEMAGCAVSEWSWESCVSSQL